MPPLGFEPTISAGERPQTYALDRAATGTGIMTRLFYRIILLPSAILRSRKVAETGPYPSSLADFTHCISEV